jgi:DNA excision repair protein ERCC-8
LSDSDKIYRDTAHKFGITDISFYPFDSLAFLSSSYDHTLKLFSSETLTASASFDLNSVVYSHAVSPIAAHLLVACATQHPVVRLVDLRTGAAAHALAGHAGAVLTVGWSPIDEHVLASGGTDGTIRFWDIRRSAGQLGVLDLEDSVGILGYNGSGGGARPVSRGKAHMGPVNGLVWADDGRHLVSTGHDEKIRVWNTIQGSNTLANFGPLVKNRNLSRQLPCLVPSNFVGSGEDILFFPSEKEILMYQLFEGKLLKRFRNPGSSQNIDSSASAKMTNLKSRVVDLAWRPHSVELYSGHGDGTIRAWKPRLPEDIAADDEEREQEIAEENERKRKRQVLEDVFQDLTRKKMIFS